MGLSFFLWAQSAFDGRQFGLCGKTIASIRRNLLGELIPFLRRLGMTVREKRSENLLTVRFGGRENTFLLFGGRDESSAALIQGSTPGRCPAGRGGPDAPELCGAGRRPVQRGGEPPVASTAIRRTLSTGFTESGF